MIDILTSPLFYIFITVMFYIWFELLYKKIKKAYLHPLILTGILLILYIFLIRVEYLSNNKVLAFSEPSFTKYKSSKSLKLIYTF